MLLVKTRVFRVLTTLRACGCWCFPERVVGRRPLHESYTATQGRRAKSSQGPQPPPRCSLCVIPCFFFLLKKSQKTTTLYLHSRVQRYTSRSRNGDIMGLTVIEDPYFRSEVGLMFMFFYSPALRSVVTVVHRPNRQEYWCTVI